MNGYHKIQTVFKRDPETDFKTLIYGDYSLPEFEYLKDNKWIYTEKVDGTNIRVIFNENRIFFKGKTDKAQLQVSLFDRLNDIFLPQLETFKNIFNDMEIPYACLYGEGYGPKIQKGGGNYRKDQSFVLFDVKIGSWWLQRKDIESIAGKLGLDIVPIIGDGSLKNMVEMMMTGFNSTWGDFKAEGIVARPMVELKARSGQRIITKIKYNDFKKG